MRPGPATSSPRCCPSERVLGPEHPRHPGRRGDLARWTGEAGDAAGARDQFAALLPIRERVLGPEHPDTLTTRPTSPAGPGRRGMRPGPATSSPRCCPSRSGSSARAPGHPDRPANLASWTGEAGDAAGARDQFAALLPVEERVLGPEHPDTLSTRANLARWTGEAGDAAAARDQFAALLPVRERVLGPEHPDTLTARATSPAGPGQAGDAAGARDQSPRCCPSGAGARPRAPGHPGHPRQPRLLDRGGGGRGRRPRPVRRAAARPRAGPRPRAPGHPDRPARNLAYWTGEAGDAAGARDQFAALLPVRERVLGPEHPDTLHTRLNLARWTGAAGDAAGARDQFAALLPVMERVSGPAASGYAGGPRRSRRTGSEWRTVVQGPTCRT